MSDNLLIILSEVKPVLLLYKTGLTVLKNWPKILSIDFSISILAHGITNIDTGQKNDNNKWPPIKYQKKEFKYLTNFEMKETQNNKDNF
jgi:hypothetical protein